MIQISRLSNQPIYVPVRVVDPVNESDESLLGATVRMAIVRESPVSADWNSAEVTGTWTAADGHTYFVVKYVVSASAFPEGVRQVWVEVTHDTNTYVLRSGPVQFY